jgi:hypothetical protein
MSLFNNKRGVSAVAVVLIVAVLAAVGVVGGAYITNKTGMGGPLADLGMQLGMEPSPQLAIKNAYQKTQEVDSMTVQAAISLEGTSRPGNTNSPVDLSIGATMNGVAFPGSGEKNESTTGSIDVSGDVEGAPMNVTLEYRTVPPNRYVRIGSMELEGTGAMDLGMFTNQWIQMPIGEDAPVSQIDSRLEVDTECQNPEAVEAYLEDFNPAQLFKSVEETGEEALEDESATQYTLTAKEDAIKNMLREVNEVGNCGDVPMEDADELTLQNAQVLVGNDTGYLRGMDVNLNMSSEQYDGTMQISSTFSNFGQEVNVEAPDDAKTMQEIIGSMFDFGGMMEGGGMEGIEIDTEAGVQGGGSFEGMDVENMDPEAMQDLQEQMEGMQMGQ